MEAHGVFTSDLYEPRTMTDILNLYKAIGVEVDVSKLEELWQAHSGTDFSRTFTHLFLPFSRQLRSTRMLIFSFLDSSAMLSFIDVNRLLDSA